MTLSNPEPVRPDPRASADVAACPVHAAGLTVSGEAACVVVPAFDGAATIGGVLAELIDALPGARPADVIVVDDGSSDATAEVAAGKGARVVRLRPNGGKGAALWRGFETGRDLGFSVALTVDADGQHPAASARRVLEASSDPRAL